MNTQADPPTLKNLDFASAGARFLKNQGLGSKDALDGVLGLSWPRFWCSWGPLGGSFGALVRAWWHPEFSKRFIWAPLSPHLGPRGALNNPKLLPKRPHGEAEGPTKPPKPIWTRIWTYFPTIWVRNQRKSEQETSFRPFEAILRSRVMSSSSSSSSSASYYSASPSSPSPSSSPAL